MDNQLGSLVIYRSDDKKDYEYFKKVEVEIKGPV